jgi:hypothetical protein
MTCASFGGSRRGRVLRSGRSWTSCRADPTRLPLTPVGVPFHTFPQGRFEIRRSSVLFQQVAKGFIGELQKILHAASPLSAYRVSSSLAGHWQPTPHRRSAFPMSGYRCAVAKLPRDARSWHHTALRGSSMISPAIAKRRSSGHSRGPMKSFFPV